MYLLTSAFNIPILIASNNDTVNSNLLFLTNEKSKASIRQTAAIFNIPEPKIVTNKFIKFICIIFALFSAEVVVGDTRLRWVRILIRFKRKGSVTIVDDGMNTITAYMEPKFLNLVERKKTSVKTIFDIDHVSCDNVKTPFLHALGNAPKLDIARHIKIILLGTVEFERGNINFKEIVNTLLPFLNSKIYYKAHRNEDESLLRELEKETEIEIELISLEAPIEYYDLTTVDTVIAFGSTAIPVLNALYPNLKTVNLGPLIKTTCPTRTKTFAADTQLYFK